MVYSVELSIQVVGFRVHFLEYEVWIQAYPRSAWQTVLADTCKTSEFCTEMASFATPPFFAASTTSWLIRSAVTSESDRIRTLLITPLTALASVSA